MTDAELINRIRDALGTAEEGENLIAVARDAHRAEMELAALMRKTVWYDPQLHQQQLRALKGKP